MTEPPKHRPGGRGAYSVKDRVALVTGGSNGIGAATVVRLADAGAVVWVGYNTGAERAADLVARLPGAGHKAVAMPMRDSAAIAAAADSVAAAHGRLDVLVNSAGMTKMIPHADLDALDDATFDDILITNVRGPFATIRAFRKLLAASGDAVIVNISSLAAVSGQGSSIVYGASKAALDVMGMSLARVLGPEIRVVGISPAAVNTGFVKGRTLAAIEQQSAGAPLRVLAEADDIALACISAIEGLRLTTGTTILVDSGRHL
jgi:3-oxoacyl-[acyl-carrier protein] reductase